MIYEKAIEKFGIDYQLNVAQEECSELIKAISKLKRATDGELAECLENLYEEIADVQIVCEELISYFPHAEHYVTEAKEKKLKRLEYLVEHGNYPTE